MSSLLTEFRIPHWCELLILILGSQFQRDTTMLFWIWRSEDCSPTSLLLHQRKFLQWSAWSARHTSFSRATGTKPKSTTATCPWLSHIPKTCHDCVCLSQSTYPQSLTETSRLKFKGMHKDEENSLVWIQTQEYRKNFHAAPLLSSWLPKSKEFHPVLHTN